jgi:hypothetical protein
MNDDGRRIALFMRFLGFDLHRAAWLSQVISDVCCPFAARTSARQPLHRGCELENASLSRFCEFSWIAVLVRMSRLRPRIGRFREAPCARCAVSHSRESSGKRWNRGAARQCRASRPPSRWFGVTSDVACRSSSRPRPPPPISHRGARSWSRQFCAPDQWLLQVHARHPGLVVALAGGLG